MFIGGSSGIFLIHPMTLASGNTFAHFSPQQGSRVIAVGEGKKMQQGMLESELAQLIELLVGFGLKIYQVPPEEEEREALRPEMYPFVA